MSDTRTIIAIDQGTTSRAILFDEMDYPRAEKRSRRFSRRMAGSNMTQKQYGTPRLMDPCHGGRRASSWHSGRLPLASPTSAKTAIIWTAPQARQSMPSSGRIAVPSISVVMKNNGHEAAITEKTGLLLDFYFTASKFAWVLDKVDGAC